MSVYTRRGDGGQTDLFGGPRVAKDHLRVEAYGAVDEANAAIGAAAAASAHEDLREIAREMQALLFELGGVLATPDAERREESGVPELEDAQVEAVERHIDRLEQELEPLRRFVLPGGAQAAAAFHVARTVCRRAERRCVALHHEEPIDAVALRYLNRLSDLLFVMARVENRRAGPGDVEWLGRKR
ncbi:MAG: cob(I)yrinic acid a,c-diamide adenosyltransferase [Myxococcales bacterium]|nr:cob(I)yrinic acid a,c-diamide adenosyltransferase [Myxococcales bacterium]MDH5306295.1 cob(I)yrinic acid a,c-diamide adenosyltransferase [Myxococcales bacterium]